VSIAESPRTAGFLSPVSSISSLKSGTPLDRTHAVSFSTPHGTPDIETKLDTFLKHIDVLRISNQVF
jgi:hypothetical protein